MISIKLLDTISSITQKINSASASFINAKLKNKKDFIQSNAKSLAIGWLMSQPEISSLSGGELAGAFGLPVGSGPTVISSITKAFTESIYCNIIPFNNKLLGGGVFIYFQPSDFSNLLSLPEGHTVYMLGDLHWLNWLLNLGDTTIVAGYYYNPKSGLGRSKLGYMKSGGSFRVPPEFSGSSDNNFITRALLGNTQEKEISQLLKRALT